METYSQLILLPRRMSALCSHDSNEQAFSPSQLLLLPHKSLTLHLTTPERILSLPRLQPPFSPYRSGPTLQDLASAHAARVKTLLPKGVQVVKRGPARSSLVDSVCPKLLPFIHSISSGLSPPPTHPSVSSSVTICPLSILSCYYNYFSYFLYLPLKLPTFLLKGAHFLYTLHWLSSRHCSCYTSSLSFLLPPLLIQHQGFHHQRLLLSAPSTINTSNYQDLPLISPPTRPLTVGYSTSHTLT
jgi:hypothetical protein